MFIISFGIASIFIPAIVVTDTTPSTSSLVTAYRAQPVPLVLGTYDSSQYFSFMVSSNIPSGTLTSATIWILESIEPIKNIYNDTVEFQNLRNLLFYALTGSTFNLTVLSHGPAGANANFEFRNKDTNELLRNWTVYPSNISQKFGYTTVTPGFIEIRPTNNGLNGTLTQNFIINELNVSSLEQSHYQCTLNSTSRSCNHTTIYSTNNLIASVTLESDNNNYPTFNTTLLGETTPFLSSWGAPLFGVLTGICVLFTIGLLFLCFYYCHIQ